MAQQSWDTAPTWALRQTADADSLLESKMVHEGVHRAHTTPPPILSSKPIPINRLCVDGGGVVRRERDWEGGELPIIRRDDVTKVVGVVPVQTDEGLIQKQVGDPIWQVKTKQAVPMQKLVEQHNTSNLFRHAR